MLKWEFFHVNLKCIRWQVASKNIGKYDNLFKKKNWLIFFLEVVVVLFEPYLNIHCWAFALYSFFFPTCLSKCKYWRSSASLPPQRRGAISYDSSDQTALYIRMLGKHHLPCLMHTHIHTHALSQPVNKCRHRVDVPLCTGSYWAQHYTTDCVTEGMESLNHQSKSRC